MLFKVYTKPFYEILRCCKVIRGLQNIFKLLTDDSIDMITAVKVYNAFGVRSIFRGSQGALAYHPSTRQMRFETKIWVSRRYGKSSKIARSWDIGFVDFDCPQLWEEPLIDQPTRLLVYRPYYNRKSFLMITIDREYISEFPSNCVDIPLPTVSSTWNEAICQCVNGWLVVGSSVLLQALQLNGELEFYKCRIRDLFFWSPMGFLISLMYIVASLPELLV